MLASKPHFLLVDDHALFRAGLTLMLDEQWPQAQRECAGTWAEAMKSLSEHLPNLILLDVHLPDAHSVARLPELLAAAPGCPVLMLSADTDGAQVEQARAAGASGFLNKSASADRVHAAVSACLQGHKAFDDLSYDVLTPAPLPGLTAFAVSESLPPAFTVRQLAILSHLGRGTPNKAIARQMDMSEMAVRAEVSWLTESLQANSRQHAYEQAVLRGLLPP